MSDPVAEPVAVPVVETPVTAAPPIVEPVQAAPGLVAEVAPEVEHVAPEVAAEVEHVAQPVEAWLADSEGFMVLKEIDYEVVEDGEKVAKHVYPGSIVKDLPEAARHWLLLAHSIRHQVAPTAEVS